MNIAVNTRYLLKENLEGYGYFTKEVLQRLVTQHPNHQFHFLFDRPFDQRFIFADNVTPHVLGPEVRHPLQWKYWYDVKVPALLKRLRADVFFSPDGQCSLTAKVSQCIAVHDLGFLHFPGAYKKSHVAYLKYFVPKFAKKAASIVTVSNFSKQDIVKRTSADESKIHVVYNGVKQIFQPISFEEQIAVKDHYTEGMEYFLYVGAIHPRKNLVNLLKGFSIFKRRLQSSMKLVVAGRLAWKNNEFLELLKTYKYRNDVVMAGYLEEGELAKLMASAYAFVYPSLFEGFGVPVAEAMKCEVPVLTSKDSAMEEVSGGAALYFDPQNIDDMADKLMRIYKDEDGRRAIIDRGKVIAAQYSWERTANAVWQAIMTAADFKS